MIEPLADAFYSLQVVEEVLQDEAVAVAVEEVAPLVGVVAVVVVLEVESRA